MTTPTPAAIYARYSTDRQAARSIDDQIRKCEDLARERGYRVVATFRDEAESGASLNRQGIRALLNEVWSGRKCRFKVVLADDLSRISRDLGDIWRVIFTDLAAAGIRMIGASDGIDSSDPNARLNIGMRGLIADHYLRDVAAKTHRGLSGRVRDGLSGGGSCLGYRTEAQANANDPDHPSYAIQIDPVQAELVQRIFALFAAGESLGTIVETLNREGTPAPRGRFWAKNQIGSVLRNERYIGRWVWNRREWIKVDGKRRYRMRPESEWIRLDRPDLRLIDQETWERVQARHRKNAQGLGAPGRGGRGQHREHLFSGLMRCGACGSPFIIVGRHRKGENSWANFGCAARHSKGEVACTNRQTVSEMKVNTKVVTALDEFYRSPRFGEWVQAAIEEAEREVAQADDGMAKLEAAVRAQQAKVDNLVAAVERVGYSEALEAGLRRAEKALRDAKAALAEAAPRKAAPSPSLALDEVVAVMRDVQRVARDDPRRAREVLAGMLAGPVVLHPGPDGYELEIRPHSSTAALAGGRPVLSVSGCGGRI